MAGPAESAPCRVPGLRPAGIGSGGAEGGPSTPPNSATPRWWPKTKTASSSTTGSTAEIRPDAPQLVPSVERVTTLTGWVPATVVADRGFGTAGNDRALAELGVRRIGLQRTGTPGKARREYERSRPFRRMRNWRVCIEARISHLKRTFGFRRTRLAGAQTWAGLGIFA